MRKQEKLAAPDYYLLGVVLALVTVGVLLVFDASYARMADAKWAHYDSWYAVKRQLVYACVGLVAMFVVAGMRLQTFIKATMYLLVISLVLLVAVKVFGHSHNGAKRWLGSTEDRRVARLRP